MMPILYILVLSLLSVNVLLGLPKAVDLAWSTVSASNVNEKISKGTIAGLSIKRPSFPPVNKGLTPPTISAAAALIEDVETKNILFTKDSDNRVPIASTTKLMTALLAAEYFKPNEVLTVPEVAVVSGSTMNLKVGEKLTLRSLLYGMMLNSGNDAAFTVAANYPGGVSSFVARMNQKAAELNLKNTNFTNPAGFDDTDHFSSAADLAKIAEASSANSQLARIVSTKQTMVASIDKTLIHSLKNLNKLLDIPGVLGMKTGTTPLAKENLVSLVERNNHRVIIVVLGSNDRFGESEKLIEWTYKNYVWN